MPNWEWRVFLPCSASGAQPGDIWSLLGAKQPRAFTEHRTDVYLTCTARVGLKLRGESQLLEVKIRKEKNEFGAENWQKVTMKSLPKGIDTRDPTAVADVFTKELLKIYLSIDDQLKEIIAEALTVLKLPQTLVAVTKARASGRVSSISLEEGTICCGEYQWRTVCLEAPKSDYISTALLSIVNVCPPGGEPKDMPLRAMKLKDYLLGLGRHSIGYPEFVLERVREIPQLVSEAYCYKHEV